MADETINIEVKSNLGELNKDIGNTSKLIRGVEGSVDGAQKAMDAFGVSSETTNKSLEGVQTAMNFTDGIKQITNLAKVIKTNTTVTKLWNLAMKANPIGLLVTAVTALIAGITALIFWMKKSSEQSRINTKLTKDSTKALKNQTKEIDDNAKAFDRKQKQELAMAKASGESVEAIRTLEIKLVDEKLAYIASERAIAKQTLAKERNTLATLKARGAEEDLIDEQFKNVEQAVDNFNTLNRAIGDTLIEREDLLNRHIVEREQAETDARNKRKEDRDQDLEDIKENDKKVEKQLQDTTDRLADIRQKDDDARELQQQIRRQKEEIAAAEEIKDVELRNKELSNLREIHFEEYLDLMDKQKTVVVDAGEDEVKTAEEIAAEKIKREKAVKDAKIGMAQDGLALISQIAGEGSRIGKAAAVSSATISGIEGVQNAYTTAQKSPFTALFPGYPLVQAGLAGAFSALQIQKILSGSPATGGGGGGGATAATPATPAPQMMSGAFELSGGVEPEPTRAYVVTDEMTNSQNQLANIRRRATI